MMEPIDFWMEVIAVDGRRVTARNLSDPDQPLPVYTMCEDHGLRPGDKVHMTSETRAGDGAD